MFYGDLLWQGKIELNMRTKIVLGETYNTYSDLPDHLYEALATSASHHPENVCISDHYGREYTFSVFLKMVDQFAAYLRQGVGICRGTHVALLLYNSIEFCVSIFALIKIGAVAVPLPSKFKEREIQSLIVKSETKCVICDEDFLPWMKPGVEMERLQVIVSKDGCHGYGFAHLLNKAFAPEICSALPEGDAILMFTSGTTAMSKGVVLTNFNIMHAVCTYHRILKITPEDTTIIPIPIYHITGIVALLGLFIYSGGRIFLHKTFDAVRVLETVKQERITFLHASPTVFSKLLEHRNKYPELPSLRMLACGSSNMPKDKITSLHKWMVNMQFRTVYGLTETSSPATIFDMDAAQSPYIGSSGLPVPGTVFKIVGDNGAELQCGEIGEIFVKGSVVLREYYDISLPEQFSEGWLATGDLGYFAENGYMFVVGRKKDMINRGGEKICSYDVENELYRLPGVSEAVVVGIPDELYGEVPVALVKLEENSNLSGAEIQRQLLGKIAGYKIPTRIMIAKEIPLTPNNKIDRKKVQALFR